MYVYILIILQTLGNHNAISKFALHSSTLMKNAIKWGGGGGALTSQEVTCSEAHCVLGLIFSLTGIYRASFSKDDK